jgi:RNA 3'-terminal phosphate cyclase
MVHQIENVLIPILNGIGLNISLDVKSHGFFPDQIGEATFDIQSLKGSLKPFQMVKRGGKLQMIDIYVDFTAGQGE